MSDAEVVIGAVRQAFEGNPYPGDGFLQGSFEGCEPYEEVGAFKGCTDWSSLDPRFLDGHYSALSFFSEAGLRFFLPAYLIADLEGRLLTADPTFHLTNGFSDGSLEERRNGSVIPPSLGKVRADQPQTVWRRNLGRLRSVPTLSLYSRGGERDRSVPPMETRIQLRGGAGNRPHRWCARPVLAGAGPDGTHRRSSGAAGGGGSPLPG